jgi:quinol---cytochrome-c reductase cytochrome b subunit
VLVHGVETGIIKRLPDGQFIEVHQPLAATDGHGHGALGYAGAPVPKKMNRLGAIAPAIRGFFFPIEKAPPPMPSLPQSAGPDGGALGSSVAGSSAPAVEVAGGATSYHLEDAKTSHHT